MVKYLRAKNSTNSELIKFNVENQNVSSIRNFSTAIDWMWVADEDGELDGKAISKGDIIFSMYIRNDEREIIVVKDECLRAFYNDRIEALKKQYEKQKRCCDCECAKDVVQI